MVVFVRLENVGSKRAIKRKEIDIIYPRQIVGDGDLAKWRVSYSSAFMIKSFILKWGVFYSYFLRFSISFGISHNPVFNSCMKII